MAMLEMPCGNMILARIIKIEKNEIKLDTPSGTLTLKCSPPEADRIKREIGPR